MNVIASLLGRDHAHAEIRSCARGNMFTCRASLDFCTQEFYYLHCITRKNSRNCIFTLNLCECEKRSQADYAGRNIKLFWHHGTSQHLLVVPLHSYQGRHAYNRSTRRTRTHNTNSSSVQAYVCVCMRTCVCACMYGALTVL